MYTTGRVAPLPFDEVTISNDIGNYLQLALKHFIRMMPDLPVKFVVAKWTVEFCVKCAYMPTNLAQISES